MTYLRQTVMMILLLLLSLFSIKGASIQEGSSYFFYQQAEYPRDCAEVLHECTTPDNSSGVHTIKPDGYPKFFEVYCSNDIASSGWTVIHRRVDGSLKFKRKWEDYKNGFGFLAGEFWIGNDKLSHLTNQAVYELSIDMTLSNGSSFHVKYNSFRISDEFSNYAIVTAEDFRSNSSCAVSTCPHGMTHGGCSCQQSCKDPIGMIDCYDNCHERCVPNGCFVTEEGTFILNGESYINIACSENCTCVENQLSCNSDYECSPDATCSEKNGLRKCYCNEGFGGDGESCSALYTDCYDAYQAGQRQNGVYSILPTGWSGSPFNVSCNMTSPGGGWTVFQRRMDGSVDFHLYWENYKNGFGYLDGEHWLGNEQIFSLTTQRNYQLRIDFVSSTGKPYYAKFNHFRINDEVNKYRLEVESYIEGDAGDSFTAYHNNQDFSTRDRDNDDSSYWHYAVDNGAWWWGANSYDINFCELNSPYGDDNSICWHRLPESNRCNMRFTEMKVRPI